MSYFKQHELGSNKATQLETFCAERNITTLTHFTRIEDLSSILQSGLLSRRQLDSQEGNFYFNDSDRYDEQKDAICLRACLNNRWQSHFWSFVESFFMFSLLAATYLWDCYRTHYGIFYRLRYPLS